MKTMVFSVANITKIKDRKKVMTRRKVSWSKSGKPIERYKLWDVCNLMSSRYSGLSLGRIQIISVYAEVLSYITDADAKLEGYKDKDEFIADWKRIHGRYNPMSVVWVMMFKYLGEEGKQG